MILQLVAWCTFYSGIATAMLFGFYWVAGRHGDVVREIGGVALSCLAGVVVATMIMALSPVESNLYAMITFASCTATMIAAVPRMCYHSLRQTERFSLGFLFRLSVYFAILLALYRAVPPGHFHWRFALGLLVVGVGFYGMLAARYFTQGLWLGWLILIPLALFTNAGFFAAFFIAWPPQFDPRFWDNEFRAGGVGVTLFYVMMNLVHAVQSHRRRFDPTLEATDSSGD